MTEDVAVFLAPGERDDRGQAPVLPRSRGWHLNDNDLSVIDTLHATCVDWLQYAKDAQSARCVADAMAALEAIAAGRSVTPTIDVTVTRKPEDRDGLSATLTISSSSIVLSVVDWVFMSAAQGHDHAWRQEAELTARGGFDFGAVDRWHFLSDMATDFENTKLSTSKLE